MRPESTKSVINLTKLSVVIVPTFSRNQPPTGQPVCVLFIEQIVLRGRTDFRPNNRIHSPNLNLTKEVPNQRLLIIKKKFLILLYT